MQSSRQRRAFIQATACGLLAVATAASSRLAAGPMAPPPSGSQESAAFERLKELQGTWIGRSNRGMQETVNLRLIANGTVLAEDSQQSDETGPASRMATMFQLDGGRLLLTHYCEAGNTPRLVASSFEDGGRTISFSFLDGVNLPTRDRGHMDKVVIHLEDADHFTSRWTWYQNGHDQWLEEIRFNRVHK